MATTPHNTPRRDRSIDPDGMGGYDPTIPIINNNIINNPLATSASAGSPSRVGGGYETSGLGIAMLNEEEKRARQWRAMGEGGMYNPDLDKFLMERKTDLYAANSFLFNKKALQATGAPQIFEYSKASSVAHHLQQQPDHYSKMVGGHSSSHIRSTSAGKRSAGGGVRRAQSAAQSRSRILGRFDPLGSSSQHQPGVIPSASNAQLLGGPIQQNAAMASAHRSQQLNASAAAMYELQQQQHAAAHGGFGFGGGRSVASGSGAAAVSAIYAPHTSFQPLVMGADGSAAGAPPSSSSTLVPTAALNSGIIPRPHSAPQQQLSSLPPSHITVEPASPPRHQSAAAVMNPTAAVYTDTTLNGTNHPLANPQASPPRLAAQLSQALSAVAAAQSPLHYQQQQQSAGGASAGGVPSAAASGGGASGSAGGGIVVPSATATTHDAGDISRHTLSSMGKTRGPGAAVFDAQHTHPHSQSYIAAQNYESYIRSKAGIGHVSAIDNIDAVLDSLAAGEPDPITGYVQPHEFKATNSSMLRVLKNSHHLIDRTMGRQGVRLGCCGSQAASGALVPAAGSKVDGLFVTYCQQDVHSQLDEAKRVLIHEQGQRQYDADQHSEKMAALFHENVRLKEALHNATVIAENRFEKMDQALRDAVELKEEYDRRAQEAKRALEETLANRSVERETIERLTLLCQEKDKKITGLEVTVFDLTKNLAVAEKQVQDVYKATTLATEEKMAAEGRASQLQKQIQELGVMLMNSDKAYQGAEYGRRFAEDKISHMAFLMSSGQQRVASSKARVQPKSSK